MTLFSNFIFRGETLLAGACENWVGFGEILICLLPTGISGDSWGEQDWNVADRNELTDVDTAMDWHWIKEIEFDGHWSKFNACGNILSKAVCISLSFVNLFMNWLSSKCSKNKGNVWFKDFGDYWQGCDFHTSLSIPCIYQWQKKFTKH